MKGISAGKGIAIGAAKVIKNTEYPIPDGYISNVEMEVERFYNCRLKAIEKIYTIINNGKITREDIEVLSAQEMILNDIEIEESICNMISQDKRYSEFAVNKVMSGYAESFLAMEKDEYFRARFQDCIDIKRMLLQELYGDMSIDFNSFEKGTILVIEELLPSQLLVINKDIISGIITSAGGETSHITILLRTSGIPSIVGLDKAVDKISDGQTVIVNGSLGECMVNPSETIKKKYLEEKGLFECEKENLKKYIDKKIYSKSGKHIKIMANIGCLEDVPFALENGAEGIGLFRTEFLFTSKEFWPSEEEQVIAYQYVSDQFIGRPVIIRTMDIGGDKPLPYYKHKSEKNPFLGLRGIRLCLYEEDKFKTQLRALLRANDNGNIRIMLPMISSLEEVRKVKSIINNIKEELSHEKLNFNSNTMLGIMIEVPSAAICADIFACEVDFFSLGTNDLIQYTMAVDRLNENVNHLYNPMNEAVIRLIRNVIQVGKDNNIEVGICGEAGRDSNLIKLLYEMEIDEISMSPDAILTAKKVLL